MAKSAPGTYVYCLVAGVRRPSLAAVPRGHTGMGRPRVLDAGRGRWLVVADAPLDRYGSDAINRGLSDLDWVSRAAVAHEAVVESFIHSAAVVPMKLFTIFISDQRALEHIAADKPRIDAVLKRVTNHLEWGVRVLLDRSASPSRGSGPSGSRAAASGTDFLARKKSQRDAVRELTERARLVVDDLYERCAGLSRLSRRRSAAELPAQGGPLLLDAAFLVPKTRSARFEKLGARAGRDLAGLGYRVAFTGPWPPYSFIQE